MNDKKSFVFYEDYYEMFKLLSTEEQSLLIMAVFEYVKNDTVPTFEGALKMAFCVIKMQIDRDSEKWEDVKKKRSDAAKKRWKQNEEAVEVTETSNEEIEAEAPGEEDFDCDKTVDDNGESFTVYFQKKFNCILSRKQKKAIDKMLSDYGEDVIVSVIDDIPKEHISSPVPYVRECLKTMQMNASVCK